MAEAGDHQSQDYGRIPWSQFQEQGTAVCKIKRTLNGQKGAASGFIGRLSINGNPIVLITNSHVLHTKQEARSASITFGYVNKDNQGITKNGEDIFDMTMWRTETDQEGDKYGLDYTLIKIKEDAVTAEYMKNIQPFDLTPTPVNENDQLYIIQYPDDPDGEQQLEQSASPCKKVIGFLAFYDSSTFNGSSGSPVVKVVNGKLQVVALHRFHTINEKSRAGSIFTEILRHACDGEVTMTTKDMVHQYIKTVTWKPLEMYPLLKCLKPVSPKWKILAVHLNVQEVATIEKDCNYNAASDEALREVVTRWHGRTTRSKRTWKTLCDAALEEDDHTLKEYIDKNQLSYDAEPEMHDVALWSKKSPLQSSGWYNLACNLINECEANNIEAKYCGKGSQECLKNVLQKWMSKNPSDRRTWEVIITALQGMDENNIVDKILKEYRQ